MRLFVYGIRTRFQTCAEQNVLGLDQTRVAAVVSFTRIPAMGLGLQREFIISDGGTGGRVCAYLVVKLACSAHKASVVKPKDIAHFRQPFSRKH
jgi:hypothetical protein